MFPGVSGLYVAIGGEHVPLLRGATTDFNTTFGLALAVVVTMQVMGMREQGVFGYLSHFIQIKQVIKGFRKSLGEGAVCFNVQARCASSNTTTRSIGACVFSNASSRK